MQACFIRNTTPSGLEISCKDIKIKIKIRVFQLFLIYMSGLPIFEIVDTSFFHLSDCKTDALATSVMQVSWSFSVLNIVM